MKYIHFLGVLLTLGLWSCTDTEEKVNNGETSAETEQQTTEDTENYILDQGFWIGSLRINETATLPFNFEIVRDSIYFINADERIGAGITESDDQIIIKMPIFDSEFRFSKTDQGLYGFWYNKAKGPNYKMDFTAHLNPNNIQQRFPIEQSNQFSYFDGNWETSFSPNTDDEYKALGLMVQLDQELTGTFLTETGDYRFLQGNVTGDSIYLSAFDGSHAFLFEAKIENDTINGTFYSGNHYQENWTAFKNDDFEISNPDSLTRMQVGEELAFSFPGLNGSMVEYPSMKYSEKVVIIQILGSWCPNCMDETKFLTQLHNTYKEQGLEVIGISFENPKTLQEKIDRVQGLKDHFGATYNFCIGGDASKKTAEAVLPALSEVISFPTTIYIDKSGIVRKIHTGFYGPGTGSYFLKFAEHTNKFVQGLLNE